MNFKEYFFREFFDGLKLSKGEEDHLKAGINTGKEHHKKLSRMMNIGDRKSLNFVAKSQSRPKKTEHPKIDLCMKTKKNIPLSEPEAHMIITKYKMCPTPEEPTKAIKQTGVSIHMVRPSVYILTHTGGEGKHGTSKIS